MAFCLTGFKSDGKCLADQKIVLKNQSEKITDLKATTMETCVCGGGGGWMDQNYLENLHWSITLSHATQVCD